MTDAEKLKMVKAMTGETDEDTLSTFLSPETRCAARHTLSTPP